MRPCTLGWFSKISAEWQKDILNRVTERQLPIKSWQPKIASQRSQHFKRSTTVIRATLSRMRLLALGRLPLGLRRNVNLLRRAPKSYRMASTQASVVSNVCTLLDCEIYSPHPPSSSISKIQFWLNFRRLSMGNSWTQSPATRLSLQVRLARIITPCRKTTLRLSLLDPATNEELGMIPDMGLSETKEALDAAAKAFTTWSKTTAKVGPRLSTACTHWTWD